MKNTFEMKQFVSSVLVLYIMLGMISCQKEFLEARSDSSVTMPLNVSDYQAMLDYALPLMNNRAPIVFQIIGGEEFYMQRSVWNAFPVTSGRFQQKYAYIWADDVYGTDAGTDWNFGYARILNANIVLDGLKNMGERETASEQWKHAYGSALFYRAWNHYLLAQSFCQDYDLDRLDALGLPLRLEADVTLKSVRATLGQTYHQIINDAVESVAYLPETSNLKTRPSKLAVYAFLARVYLQMGDYETALSYADQGLAINDHLLDYNSYLSANPSSFTFENNMGLTNPEVVFFDAMSVTMLGSSTSIFIHDELLSLYADHDLRRQVYFSQTPNLSHSFIGSYSGASIIFVGLTTGELTLIKAEVLARKGSDDASAREQIRKLWAKRFSKESVLPIIDQSGENLLRLVLQERRRELVFRGVRWSDLRRLNKQKGFETILERETNEGKHMLEPGSNRYTWPIPDEVIRLSGIQQNPR